MEDLQLAATGGLLVKLETLVYQRISVKRQCHDVYLTYIVSEREVPLRNA